MRFRVRGEPTGPAAALLAEAPERKPRPDALIVWTERSLEATVPRR